MCLALFCWEATWAVVSHALIFSFPQGSAAQEPIVRSARSMLDSSTYLLETARSLVLNPKDPPTWSILAGHSRTISDSIKSLITSIRLVSGLSKVDSQKFIMFCSVRGIHFWLKPEGLLILWHQLNNTLLCSCEYLLKFPLPFNRLENTRYICNTFLHSSSHTYLPRHPPDQMAAWWPHGETTLPTKSP